MPSHAHHAVHKTAVLFLLKNPAAQLSGGRGSKQACTDRIGSSGPTGGRSGSSGLLEPGWRLPQPAVARPFWSGGYSGPLGPKSPGPRSVGAGLQQQQQHGLMGPE